MIPRVIPCLLVQNGKLVKSVQFRKPTYVGDPVNAICIFNDKEVDELAILDISAIRQVRGPDFGLLSEISSECFMPISYGGGLRTVQQVAKLFKLGVEKAILNTIVAEQPALVTEAADIFGSSSIVVSMDVRKNWRGKCRVVTRNGANVVSGDPIAYARAAAALGAGELLVTAVDREGRMERYDTDLTSTISNSVDIPVVANGGKHYESIYTRFFQSYILPVKFGIDKRKAHLSSLIASGRSPEQLHSRNLPAQLLIQHSSRRILRTSQKSSVLPTRSSTRS